MTNLLTSRQTAKRLGITTQTLYEWRKRKKYLRYTKIGGRAFYYEEDLITFLQQNTFIPEE